ncbi:hypothetical protein ACFWUQ_22625 [Streptomyces sp. NPDC058662]|uniref:hypothetical protein n=1 Tax=Streptomyces sp. NPDC058662 TaxID=3346583 RepID=UPI003661F6C4
MEEELVAGESPDKSVDEGAPGAAQSSADHDPRLSVFRPREPEGGAARPRPGSATPGADAGAATRADASEADAGAAEADASEADAAERAAAESGAAGPGAAEPRAGAAGADAAESEGSSDADADADAAEPEAGASGSVASGPEASEPEDSGAVAAEPEGAAERGEDADGASDGAADADARRRDPLREAVAAWVASAEAGEDAGKGSAAAPGPGVRGADTAQPAGSGSAVGGEPAEDGATAVFRVAKPAAASPAEDSVSASSAPSPLPSADADAAASEKPERAAEEPASSERTAVFRTVKPPSAPAAEVPKPSAGEPADSERTAVFRAFKPDAVPAGEDSGSSRSRPTATEPADSERTAVFRAFTPASGSAAPSASAPAGTPAPGGASSAPGKSPVARPAAGTASGAGAAPERTESAAAERAASAGSADSERTAVFRAVRPDAAPPKASTFVPLRTDDAAPKPAEAPASQPAPAPAPASASQPAPASTPRTAATRGPAPAESPERTTQQPLPPKPPLDMLADLTNNPPPPPSPLRTAVRRVKIYAPLVVLLAVVLAVVQLVRPLPEPKLVMTAKSSYAFAGAKPELPWPAEGQAYMAAAGLGTLGQSGEQKPVPIASVTKSMTAYIILRDHPIKKGEQGEMIDVDRTAEAEGKKNNSTDNESTLDTVKEGDKISEYDAIAALMIPSANNIARLLARWDAGSQEAFVKKMNDTAKELGMTKTTYTDPSGLDATTVSTAEDQVKLGLRLVEMETLLDITKKTSWVDPSGKNWRNWNGLTGATGALGIKTGTTTKAGGNLLFAAQKKIGNTNQLIVGAVLGQHKPPIIDSVLAESKRLMQATQKALEGAPVVKKGDVVGYVDDGLGGRTPVVATADVQAVGWGGLTVAVKLADGGGTMPQTAKAGTEVGVLTVGEGASQVKVPVVLQGDLAAPGLGSKLTRVG